MSCGGCVSSVSVSLGDAVATMRYDENVTSEALLKSAVVGAGCGVDATGSAAISSSNCGCCF